MDKPMTSASHRPQVLTVGHCSADHARLCHVLARAGAGDVHAASDKDEALRMMSLRNYRLALVNRVFDAEGTSGLDFLRLVFRADVGEGVWIMLVSNHADAQENAIALGALPGFGKSDLHSPALAARLTSLLQ